MQFHIVLVCLLLLLSAVNFSQQRFNSEDDHCPPWQWRNATGDCECGGTLRQIVHCQEKPHSLQLYVCYCMTYSQKTLVGACQYTCLNSWRGDFFPITINSTSQLNEFMCSDNNRQGQLCGSCVPGYAPPVYSYYLSCVNCTTSNWGKYTAVSLLPLTAFFVFVITFRLSATSPNLNGFILCVQILTSPPNMRTLANAIVVLQQINSKKFIIESDSYFVISTLAGIWNLDFFRLVYTPFCLQPHTNTLQVLALDYVVAVYPLLLITLSYLLVLLYDRNVRLIVCLWKLFLPLFIKFRRQWNIRNSLVEAFTTFFLLSYVKILSVSVDLLVPVLLYDQHGHTLPQPYLFIQGDLPFLGSQHLPYACLALFFLLTFTLLPMLLLFLYPCSCFQACLNRTGCSCQPLHTFMDTFQGHYKNGTNATRDLRVFSGLYLFLRVVVYASTVVTYQIASYAYTTVIIAMLALSVALARPYKKNIYNIIDACLLLTTTVIYIAFIPMSFSQNVRVVQGLTPLATIAIVIMIFYAPLPCIIWLVSSLRVKMYYCHKLHQNLRRIQLCPSVKMCCYKVYQKMRGNRQCLRDMSVNRDGYEGVQPQCQ